MADVDISCISKAKDIDEPNDGFALAVQSDSGNKAKLRAEEKAEVDNQIAINQAINKSKQWDFLVQASVKVAIHLLYAGSSLLTTTICILCWNCFMPKQLTWISQESVSNYFSVIITVATPIMTYILGFASKYFLDKK